MTVFGPRGISSSDRRREGGICGSCHAPEAGGVSARQRARRRVCDELEADEALTRGTFLLGTTLLLAACAAVAPTPSQSATPNLSGTSWQLVKFQGSDDKTLTPDDKTKYTIQFNTDGVLSHASTATGSWHVEVVRSKSTAVGSARAHPSHVPARIPARSDRQALELHPLVHHQE